MTPDILRIIDLAVEIDNGSKKYIEDTLRVFLRDWERKHTSLYDTGEI